MFKIHVIHKMLIMQYNKRKKITQGEETQI